MCLTCEARARLVVMGRSFIRSTSSQQKRARSATVWALRRRRGELGTGQPSTAHGTQPMQSECAQARLWAACGGMIRARRAGAVYGKARAHEARATGAHGMRAQGSSRAPRARAADALGTRDRHIGRARRAHRARRGVKNPRQEHAGCTRGSHGLARRAIGVRGVQRCMNWGRRHGAGLGGSLAGRGGGLAWTMQ